MKYANEQMFSQDRLTGLYDRLYQVYGPQHWWPADTRFEVIVGAVLTQNTAWVNVEKAITNLRRSNLLTLEDINRLDPKVLAESIRPSGYFNIKARRLKNLCAWIAGQGGMRKRGQIYFSHGWLTGISRITDKVEKSTEVRVENRIRVRLGKHEK